ncbi:MAG: 5'/3'-nucleotidase SurE [Deltaproteobacteria bacterium]|nr:5'/3'-nucleotidase SurE [Deltaproteobacteria bacterium]MBW2015519.1 5'/3'-nucleotidase SurE [Deltaproteobacteria bacterium]MBW2302190.1 5'/3'-nucleotidase SurE [Deltaproteobacteria bacterium]
MRILLTNDDGIYAPGLKALYDELSSEHEIHIVAPESERSAVGHAITLTRPLRVKPVSRNGMFYGYAVSGTPADCVKIALQEILNNPPDMVLSGINLGANVGVNVLYSGTVSAATEGAFLGIRSAAISLATRENPDFRFAARFSREIIRFAFENELSQGVALNVNIPALPPEKIEGVVITRQGIGRHLERFERRVDPRGNIYYWLSEETPITNNAIDTDARLLRENRITITPISYDLTSHQELERLKACAPPSLHSRDAGKE